jgi:hypothetical protein
MVTVLGLAEQDMGAGMARAAANLPASVRYELLISDITSDKAAFLTTTKDKRGGGTRLRAMRRRMLLAQSDTCPMCGKSDMWDFSDQNSPYYAEWAHLVPNGYFDDMSGMTGGARIGWVDGNMTVQHRMCNRSWGERVVTFEALAAPEVIYTGTWANLPMMPR